MQTARSGAIVTLAVAAWGLLAAPARAEPGHAVEVAAGASRSDTDRDALEAALRYRFGAPHGTRVGLDVELGASAEGRIGGFAAEDTRSAAVRGVVVLPAVQRGPLTLGFRLGLGGAVIDADDPMLVEPRSYAIAAEASPVIAIRLREGVHVRTGITVPVLIEVAPATSLAVTAQLLKVGLSWRLGGGLLFADLDTGPAFGFDGDGTKYFSRVALGWQWTPGDTPLF